MRSRWIWKTLLILVLVPGFAGGAQATGVGSSSDWGGGTVDDVHQSLDGTLEFSDFEFHGVDPDDVEIEIGDRDITFSGDVSVTGSGWHKLQISYTVRSLTDSGITGTTLRLDSDLDGGRGAVIASKKISASHDSGPTLPWLSLGSWKHGNGDDDDGWRGDDHAGGMPDLGRWDGKWRGSRQIGMLLAYHIASGWICGCGHHHESADDVEAECGIEQATDSVEYDEERVLHIQDTVKLMSFGKGGVTWHSVTNGYVVTPEPGTAGLVGLGLAGLIASGRRRRRAACPDGSPGS